MSDWNKLAIAGGLVLIVTLYYAAKPVAKLTFYDPDIITATAPATNAGVANAAS